MALSDARWALMSRFRFPFWPVCQARKVLVSALKADLRAPRRPASPWLCRVGAKVELI